MEKRRINMIEMQNAMVIGTATNCKELLKIDYKRNLLYLDGEEKRFSFLSIWVILQQLWVNLNKVTIIYYL